MSPLESCRHGSLNWQPLVDHLGILSAGDEAGLGVVGRRAAVHGAPVAPTQPRQPRERLETPLKSARDRKCGSRDPASRGRSVRRVLPSVHQERAEFPMPGQVGSWKVEIPKAGQIGLRRKTRDGGDRGVPNQWMDRELVAVATAMLGRLDGFGADSGLSDAGENNGSPGRVKVALSIPLPTKLPKLEGERERSEKLTAKLAANGNIMRALSSSRKRAAERPLAATSEDVEAM